MGYVMPRRRGVKVATEWTRDQQRWAQDRRELDAKQNRQEKQDLADMEADNATHDPLWPEFRYHVQSGSEEKKCTQPNSEDSSKR